MVYLDLLYDFDMKRFIRFLKIFFSASLYMYSNWQYGQSIQCIWIWKRVAFNEELWLLLWWFHSKLLFCANIEISCIFCTHDDTKIFYINLKWHASYVICLNLYVIYNSITKSPSLHSASNYSLPWRNDSCTKM